MNKWELKRKFTLDYIKAMIEYAEKRTKEHIYNFTTLYNQIKNNSVEEAFLSELEYNNNIFPNIDYRVYIKK